MLLHLFSKVNLWIQFGNRNKNRNAYVHSYGLIAGTCMLGKPFHFLNFLLDPECVNTPTLTHTLRMLCFPCFCPFSVLHLKVFKILREVAHREDVLSWSTGCLVVFWSLDLSLPLLYSECSAHPKTVMSKPAPPRSLGWGSMCRVKGVADLSTPLYFVFEVLGIKSNASCMLGKLLHPWTPPQLTSLKWFSLERWMGLGTDNTGGQVCELWWHSFIFFLVVWV